MFNGSDKKVLGKLEMVIVVVAIISFFLFLFTESLVFVLIVFYSAAARFLILGIDKYLQKKTIQSIISIVFAIILFIIIY